jgi:hypothetical protein
VVWSSVSPDCSPQLELGVLRSGLEASDVARELRGGTSTSGAENSRWPPSPSSLDPFFSFVSADVEASLERASYSSADLCGPPASQNGGDGDKGEKNLYAAELRGLEPGKLHAYRLFGGSSSSELRTPAIEASFRAPPVASRDSGATVFVFGDMGDAQHPRDKDPGAQLVADAVAVAVDEVTWRGQGKGIDFDDDDADDSEDLTLSSLTRARTRGEGGGEGKKDRPRFPAGGPPLVLHVGDVAYADGDPRGWERFMNQIQGSASRAPYGVAAGNHDVGWEEEEGGGCSEEEEDGRRRRCDGGGGGRDAAANVVVRDATGSSRPYLPEWGDRASAAFGPDSRGECGVPLAARFAAFGAPAKKRSPPDDDDDDSNDDAGDDAPSSCFAPLRRPRPPPPSDPTRQPVRPFWYSFEHGPIHFVVVSTEHSLEPGSRQRAWLEAHLRREGGAEAIDRCRTPWVALAAHRPM